MSYFERIKILTKQLKSTKYLGVKTPELRNAIQHNNLVMKNGREGEYLIKKVGEEFLGAYVHYTYSCPGWFPTGTRANAAWFKREELPEVLNHFKRGFKVVKLSRNKK